MTKTKAIALALFAAGVLASYALAGNGHGNGHGRHDGKAVLCHKAGKSGHWVRLSVAQPAVKAHLRHGDVAADASGNCPGAATTTTTTSTTTAAPTTTAATTTSG